PFRSAFFRSAVFSHVPFRTVLFCAGFGAKLTHNSVMRQASSWRCAEQDRRRGAARFPCHGPDSPPAGPPGNNLSQALDRKEYSDISLSIATFQIASLTQSAGSLQSCPIRA